jgi:hypothetical protein
MRLVTAASVVTTVLACSLAAARDAHARETASVDDESEGAAANEDGSEEAFGAGGNLRTRAEEVSFDARLQTLELAGNVRVDSPPFHLRSQRIKMTRTRLGVEIVGKGSLAFCPCLGTPLKVDFDKAIVAPPGDLILKNPTLRFYGVPVLPLPYFWLRSDEKPGLLPPDLAYRGADGLYVGGGLHLPWKSSGEKHALDLRGGAYLLRGFVVDARLRTPSSTTKVRYDHLPSEGGDDGLLVDARGATMKGDLAMAWDADVLRGRRGLAATTDLDAAARPWDRTTIEGALRSGPFVVATAMRAVTRRGGGLDDVDASGPVTSLRASGAVGSTITYDATVEGGSLRLSNATTSPNTLSFLRAEVGTRAVYALGALEASLALRGAGDVAAEGQDRGDDRAGAGRARLAVPLIRRFDAARDPWLHVIEPFAEAAVLHAKGDWLLDVSPARSASAVDGTAPLAEAGFTTTLGRWGTREAFELGGAFGGAFGSQVVGSNVRPLARARAAASHEWVGAFADAADVFKGDASTPRGVAVVARVRLGRSDGVRVLANVATRDGIDPVLARALFDAPLEPAAGFLTEDGTTGGAGLVMPWSRVITTSIGADGDVTRNELVGARAGVELRDRCGCLTLRGMGSHRIGRDGVDVWFALDFVADR